jgi:fumarylacetoacetase
MINPNDIFLKSWIEVDKNSDFPIQNIPFGVLKTKTGETVCASRIGDFAINLAALADLKYFDHLNIDPRVFHSNTLNDFIALGQQQWRAIRSRIAEIFEIDNLQLMNNEAERKQIVIPIENVEMLMPVSVGDYTDFYSSIDHATNVGKMFRDPDNALMPNWKHIPVGYHGRSSSIVVSGTNIHRPKGQVLPKGETTPIFSESKTMDFELEMAFITGKATELGEHVTVEKAEEHIFGMVIFNDLSARDIQKWEYVPLGPFLGKNFGSVVSPWIVTLDALEPFRVSGAKQEPEVLPYLKSKGDKNIDIDLQVFIQPEGEEEQLISHSNYKYMYWNMNQQLAHQTINGCNINVGDMYASGTISGPDESSYGSMLELSWGGQKTIQLKNGVERKFMQDNDRITIRAFAENNRIRIGFGECTTKLLPAK